MRDGSVHFAGLGNIAAYYDRGDIIQVFGAPYSSGTMFSLYSNMKMNNPSVRRPKTGIWDTELFDDEGVVAEMTDFAATDTYTIARRINAKKTVEFSLEFLEDSNNTPDSLVYLDNVYPEASFAASLLVEAGYHAYAVYPFPYRQYFFVLAKGNVTWRKYEKNVCLTVNPGVSEIYFTGSTRLGDANKAFEKALKPGAFEKMEKEALEYWKEFFTEHDIEKTVPATVPHREKLLNAVESTMVNICTQQAKEGGVLAGYNYHMGYVRDQYGTARGLLSMGCVQEAKRILEFYRQTFAGCGQIKNAQGMGAPGMFHVHENDQSEITGYLIDASFDVYEKLHDDQFMMSLQPMLTWAVEEQISKLHNGMMPFNGDETYIAGRMFPRAYVEDGSLEATMLFVRSTKLYLDYFGDKISDEKRAEYKAALDEATEKFEENFIIDGRMITNNPKRLEGLEFDEYRPGICLGNYQERKNPSCDSMGWQKHVGNGVYLCMSCISKGIAPEFEHKIHNVRSVSLSPKYMRSDLVPDHILKKEILEIAHDFVNTGKLPSRPEGGRTVGYDYGFLLYNLVGIDQQLALYVYEKTLDILDETGAWVEYYEDGVPQGTRYRPWESGINIEALITFANYYYK